MITSYSEVVNISDDCTLAWPRCTEPGQVRVSQPKLLKVNMGTAENSQQTILIAAEDNYQR